MSNPACQKKPSPKKRKSYRRSVLHRAALAAPSLPPPKNGSLRQAALAMVKRLQADSVSPVTTPSTRKRSYSESNSPNAHSPSNFHPLAQRIRSDLQIGEDSPEKEQLRMQLTPLKSPFPSPTRGFPSPAPLAFTPPKIQEKCETPVTPSVENVQTQEEVSCLNCDAQMTPDHQCESVNTETSESDKPEVVTAVESECKLFHWIVVSRSPIRENSQ